ncbi:MAG: putative 4-mercaptohistidine N1-methyltransferase [Candidatus Hydrogenedentes bacterium]|nr:putative 4-mercaptohistidine N1-methyltransferase [Candidatus Hydrogenedentota bacterium]
MVQDYESDDLLQQYLLFHYGKAKDRMPYGFGPEFGAPFPARVVREFVEAPPHAAAARALDLGCAVGRSSFELARHFGEVVGIDYSAAFIRAAHTMREAGEMRIRVKEEGRRYRDVCVSVHSDILRSRVHFEVGDAMALRDGLSDFDVVLMLNVIDRLHTPLLGLERLAGLVKPGGQLVLSSPYTWMAEFTPVERWLGHETGGGSSFDALQSRLEADFALKRRVDFPMVIREHSRKYQYCVPEVSVWRRR